MVVDSASAPMIFLPFIKCTIFVHYLCRVRTAFPYKGSEINSLTPK